MSTYYTRRADVAAVNNLRHKLSSRLVGCALTVVLAFALCLLMAGSGFACNTSISLTAASNYCGVGGSVALTAHVTKTSDGSPAPDHNVTFTVSGSNRGACSPGSASTNSNGDAASTYTAGTTGGEVTITAKDTTAPNQPTATCTIKVVKIITQTFATVPADRTRLKVGIGEDVTCSTEGGISVTWALSGNGSISSTSGSSTTFTASCTPSGHSGPVVYAMAGTTELDSKEFTVVAPSGLTAESCVNTPPGTPGNVYIGMCTVFTVVVTPTDVNFSNAELRENIPRQAFTGDAGWPDGTDYIRAADEVEWSPDNDNKTYDTVSRVDVRSRLLKNGVYTGCSFPVSVPEEYKDGWGNWVSWYTSEVHAKSFVGSNQKGVAEFKADNTMQGSYQGPFATLQ